MLSQPPKPPSKKRNHSQRPIALVCMSPDEFGRATGISSPTLYRMMGRGELKFVKIGRLRKIPSSELARLGLTDAE
jgi:excisionase family DNA binding protein